MAECFRSEKPNCPLSPGCALTSVLDGGKEAMPAELDRHMLAELVAETPATRKLAQ